MADPESELPQVGTVLWGYPSRAGVSCFPLFLQVRKITKTGMLSCVGLHVTKTQKAGELGWTETPKTYKDMRKAPHGDILVKVGHKEAPLWCPSKRACLEVYDGKPKTAVVDILD